MGSFLTGDQLMGIFRAIIPGVVAAATHYGLGTDAQDTLIATAVATGIVAAWSTYTNSQTMMIQAVNKENNGVKVVSAVSTSPQVSAPIAPIGK